MTLTSSLRTPTAFPIELNNAIPRGEGYNDIEQTKIEEAGAALFSRNVTSMCPSRLEQAK